MLCSYSAQLPQQLELHILVSWVMSQESQGWLLVNGPCLDLYNVSQWSLIKKQKIVGLFYQHTWTFCPCLYQLFAWWRGEGQNVSVCWWNKLMNFTSQSLIITEKPFTGSTNMIWSLVIEFIQNKSILTVIATGLGSSMSPIKKNPRAPIPCAAILVSKNT